MNSRIINKTVLMVALVVFGISGLAFANTNSLESNSQGVTIDVRAEGPNIFGFENVTSKSHDMRDTAGSYGVSPTWGNAKDDQVWIDVRSEGPNIFGHENVSLKSNDLRGTTSSFGIAPTWSNPQDEQGWYELNVLGR
jgi:hypothetical protein